MKFLLNHADINITMTDNLVIMAFVDCEDPTKDEENFTDEYHGQNLRSFYVFQNPQVFIKRWKEIINTNTIDGMWYWVWYGCDERAICSGACDPNDIEGFVENMGLSKEVMNDIDWED